MAMTFRTPAELLLNQFTSSEQSVIAATAVQHMRKQESSIYDFFCFDLPPKARERLTDAGLYLSPNSYVSHSHPVCKTLENHILYTVLPSLVDNSFYFVGIKAFKLEFLKSRNSSLSMVGLINRYVTSMDRNRYGQDFHTSRSSVTANIEAKSPGLLSSATLVDLVPAVISSGCRNLFIHDELHYWTKKDLIAFLSATRPNKLLATVVIPPELLAKSKISLNTWCYEYEIDGDQLLFYPDRKRSELYTQPLSCTYLLRTSEIRLPNGDVYMLDLVHSKFAHHLISITRGKAVGQRYRAFGDFEAISAKCLAPVCSQVGACFPIAYSTVSKIYRYLCTLLKPDGQSAMAKLSQIIAEPTAFEVKFTQEFSKFVMKTGKVDSLIMPDYSKRIVAFLAGILPRYVCRLFASYREVTLDDFMSTLCAFSFKVTTQSLDVNAIEDLDFADMEFGMEPMLDIDTVFDTAFMAGKKQSPIPDRLSSPTAAVPLHGRKYYMYEVRKEDVLSFLVSYFKKSQVGPESFSFSTARLFRQSRRLLMRTNFGLCCFALVNGHMLSRIKYKVALPGRVACTYFYHYGDFDLMCQWFLAGSRGNRYVITDGRREIDNEWVVGFNRVIEELRGGGLILRKNSILSAKKKEIWVPIEYQSGFKPLPKDEVKNEVFVGYKEEVAGPEPLHESQMSSAQIEQIMEDFDLNNVLTTCLGQSSVVERVLNAYHLNTIDLFTCSCGTTLPSGRIEDTGVFENLFFPDELNGRFAGFFSKRRDTVYKYTGGCHENLGWAIELDHFLSVNGFLDDGYDCLLAQEYMTNEGIGFHSDNEAIFEVGSKILTVNLRGDCDFLISGRKCSCSRKLEPCEFLVMPNGFQQSHRHSVRNTSIGRISLTFRVLKKADEQNAGSVLNRVALPTSSSDSETSSAVDGLESFVSIVAHGTSIDIRRGCNHSGFRSVPTIGDGNCFWHAMGFFMGVNGTDLKVVTKARATDELKLNDRERVQMESNNMAESDSIAIFCRLHRLGLTVFQADANATWVFEPIGVKAHFYLLNSHEHYEPLLPKNDCALTAVSEALNRKPIDVFNVIARVEHSALREEYEDGDGISAFLLEELFRIFGIEASVDMDGTDRLFNQGGAIKACFEVKDDHIRFLKSVKKPSLLTLRVDARTQFSKSALLIVKNAGTEMNFAPNRGRMTTLADSFYNGTTGAILSHKFDYAKNYSEEPNLDFSERSLCVVSGTFGAGKSYLFRKFIQASPGKAIYFVSPRRSLAEDISKSIFKFTLSGKKIRDAKNMNYQIWTFETFIKYISMVQEGHVVIIDEMQLYPPGYLDLVCSLLNPGAHLFIVGDPCQSDYDSEKDRAIFHGVTPDMMLLLQDREYKFIHKSMRFRNSNFEKRLPCKLDKGKLQMHEEYYVCDDFEGLREIPIEYRRVFLVSSFEEKRVVKLHYPDDVAKCLTYGESTGMTYRYGTVVVTSTSENVSDRRWVTALSRFSTNLCILNLTGLTISNVANVYYGRSLGKFLTGTASDADLLDLLPGKPNFADEFSKKIGKDAGVREEKLSGDPWLKTMVFLGQDNDVQEAQFLEELMQEPYFKTHLPQCEVESIRAQWAHKILLKEYREVRCGDIVSNQFTDEHSKNKGAKLTNAAERFETIYPRHRANDTVTFIMAVKKRLTFSHHTREMAKLREAMVFGELFLSIFLEKVPLKRQMNTDMFSKAVHDFEEKKTSKSTATIANHSNRSCRDWLADVGMLFMKSQLCTKFDNRFRLAKAAQTIVCFQHSVLCRFAPYMRYIEMKLHEVLPENFYIHSGRSLGQLNEWVITHKFDSMCTESDYEAFDASQDQYIMAFEVHLMRYLGLPRDLIDDYIFIKTHLGCKLGNFAIMRFSGEASTFLFNTMANMLFTFMRYDITGKEAICFAGDDMCANVRGRISTQYEQFLKKLRLTAKVDFTLTPTFCGWNLTSDGIYKKPQLVLERMLIAKETNNLRNCIDNYAIEVSYAYKLGERALNRMSIEEANSHYACVRVIVQNFNMIKSSVADVFRAVK
nr:replication protein [Rose virus C]